MKITIKLKDLKAVAYAMPTKDVRFYLNGVLVETRGVNTFLVATDGARVHVVSAQGDEHLEGSQNILPAEMVKDMLKAKVARHQTPEVELSFGTPDPENGGVWVEASLPNGTVIRHKTIDGRFPDWRRVVPSQAEINKDEPQVSALNPSYCLDAVNGLNAYLETSNQPVSIRPRGDKVAILSYYGFTACVMPIRTDVVPICSTVDASIHADGKPTPEAVFA